MSAILESPFRKPQCGDMFNLGQVSMLKDVLGGLINLQAVGTDPDVVGPITGAYIPDPGHVNPDGTFFIIPETDNATYVVELADGSQFTITGAQAHTFLGQPVPMRILQVISSTGNYSVVW
jgi:hypothetical protein